MLRPSLIALAACSLLACGSSASSSPPPAAPASPAPAPVAEAEPAPPPANDYSQPETWLCAPGHNAACEANLETTVVAANGTTKLEKFTPARAPAIDCFYVYPTVSRDPGIVATMTAAPEELAVVAQQFARFGQVCRPFAPLYRQLTLTALIARMSGHPLPGKVDPKTGYLDIVNAWNYYLEHDNHGRGVVLIGHSQGSNVLAELIKHEIEGKPVQRQIVSAILMGSWIQVPAGKDVGGDFASIPLCHKSSQIGCLITYASFRAATPPDATTLFGKSGGAGLEAACTNPAALAGGAGAANSYFATKSQIVDASSEVDWIKGKSITTPFVATPGLVTAACAHNDVATYLAVTVHPTAGSPRTADIPGDVLAGGGVRPEWGLHLIDANLFMGNLIAIVRDQAAAYARAKH